MKYSKMRLTKYMKYKKLVTSLSQNNKNNPDFFLKFSREKMLW